MTSALGPQFQQLKLLYTPEEVGDMHSGDYEGKKMADVPDLLDFDERSEAKVNRLAGFAKRRGGITRPIAIGLRDGQATVHDGHHRAAASMLADTLIPARHHEYDPTGRWETPPGIDYQGIDGNSA